MEIRQCLLKLQLKMSGIFLKTQCISLIFLLLFLEFIMELHTKNNNSRHAIKSYTRDLALASMAQDDGPQAARQPQCAVK